jgi:hypothetical protein
MRQCGAIGFRAKLIGDAACFKNQKGGGAVDHVVLEIGIQKSATTIPIFFSIISV